MFEDITLPKDVGAPLDQATQSAKATHDVCCATQAQPLDLSSNSVADQAAAAEIKHTVEVANTHIPFSQLESFHGASMDDVYLYALKLHDQSLLSTEKLNKIAASLRDIQDTLHESSQHRYIVRQARLSDIDSLQNMINYWAQQGENLPRSREDLIRNILTFAVCVKDREVLGCACLYVYDTGLAEIRSLGVNPMIQRQGQGRAIVEFLIHKAKQFELKKVFVLTRNPKFFAKVGFTLTHIEELPEKILKDCDHCPKKERCDEVAYEINL